MSVFFDHLEKCLEQSVKQVMPKRIPVVMDSFIFQQKQQDNNSKEMEERYYCILGSEDYMDDEGFPRKKYG